MMPMHLQKIQKLASEIKLLKSKGLQSSKEMKMKVNLQSNTDSLHKFVVAEDSSTTKRMQLKRGVWRLFNSTMESKWNELEAEMMENGIQILSKSKLVAPKPLIVIKGDRNIVAQMNEKFMELQKSVHELEFTIVRPGIVQHFYNDPHGQVSLTGIESKAKVCIELEIQRESTELDPITPAGSSCKKVCTANTRGVTVNLYIGDITLFNRAEVIVNAANEDLDHGSGVAKAIVDRGGQIISKDSQDYISKRGRVPTGSAVLFRRVGNLPPPYQAIVHAVGPRWSSQSGSDKANKNTALLRKTVKNTLKQAKNFNSIAIPAISSGGFGFPVDVAANSLVQGVIEFIEGNSTNCILNEVDFIIFDDKLPSFKRVFLKYLPNLHVFDETLLTAKATATKTTPTKSSSSPHMNLRTRSRREFSVTDTSKGAVSSLTGKRLKYSLLRCIKIIKDDVLKHKCEVLVNVTNQQLDLEGCSDLLKAAGSGLQDECQSIPKPIQYGDIVTTKAHQLIYSKHIVHVVLPGYNGSQSEKVLRGVVNKFLQECTRLNAKSVSIPSIGTGNLGYPSDVVAKCLLDEAFQYLSDNEGQTSLQLVHFVIYDDAVYKAFQQYHQYYNQTSVSSINTDTIDPVVSDRPTDILSCSFSLPNGLHLYLKQGDIADEHTDVIVNTTNPELRLVGGGVSGALLHRGGQALQDACDRARESNMRAAEGKVVETRCEGIGQLRCKSIFHVVFEGKEQDKLVETILACLDEAEKMKYTSIAIPAIGTGIIGYSSALLAEGMVTALKQFTRSSTPNHVKEICIIIIPNIFKDILKKFTDAFEIIEEEKDGTKKLSDSDASAQLVDIPCEEVVVNDQSDSNTPIDCTAIKHSDNTDYLQLSHPKDNEESDQDVVNSIHFDTKVVSMCVNESEEAVKRAEIYEAIDQSDMDHTTMTHVESHHLSDSEESEDSFEHIATPLDKDVLSGINFDTEVTMCIYGENYQSVRRAEKMLRSIVDTIVINEEIDDVNIPELSSTVIDDLQEFAHDHNVDIDIDNDPVLHTIKLHGCQKDVLKVKDKVRDVLTHIHQFKAKKEVASIVSKHFKWVRQLSDGQEDYDTIFSFEIEQAYQQNKDSYSHNGEGDRFTIDFLKMEETDFDTGEKVKVYRVDFAEVYEKPSEWVSIPKDSNNKEATVHLVTLKQNDREYQDTLSKFDATMKSKYNQIVSIQRIQNPVLFGQYIHRKKEMEKRNPPDCQNERWLFHGTKPAVINAINTQGLNRSFKNVSAYGQGVYFMRDAFYSHGYTQPDHNNHRYMYLARVLTGEYTVGNHSMIVPPPKNHSHNQHVLFDSTVNNIANPSIFTVYTDSQAYTSYLITYK